jgi:5'-nucleotidase
MLLLTNDDGIHADGLRALEKAAHQWQSDVITVAPLEPHSGCGHRVTVDRPLEFQQVEENRYYVNGTPADCVRLAFATLKLDQPGWVLSGINAGGNLGVDIHHSGTVAAAREAALHGWPAMALSQYHRRGKPIDWDITSSWAGAVFSAINGFPPLGRGQFLNVNFPHRDNSQADHPPPIVACDIDPSPLPLQFITHDDGWMYQGKYQDRPRQPGKDVDICFGGQIALSLANVV